MHTHTHTVINAEYSQPLTSLTLRDFPSFLTSGQLQILLAKDKLNAHFCSKIPADFPEIGTTVKTVNNLRFLHACFIILSEHPTVLMQLNPNS